MFPGPLFLLLTGDPEHKECNERYVISSSPEESPERSWEISVVFSGL